MRNNYVILMQSLIKDTNHLALKMLEILDGPKILICIKEKGLNLELLNGNESR